MRTTTRQWRVAAGVAAAALVLSACGGDGGADDANDLTGELDTSVSGEVTILHALTGETDVAGLSAMVAAFEEMFPDITVQQEGSNDFESLARTRVGSNQAPDIIFHPQPGLLVDFYNEDATRLLNAPTDRLSEELVGGLVDLGTIDGNFVATPVRLSLKSLVWYNKPLFDEGGYTEPETWDEMMALTEQIAADGNAAPWCIGIESGDATGWVATDWVEDIILRALGPDQYDAWVAGDLDFASEEVQGALEQYMEPIWTNDDFVNGGRANIARTAFGDAVLPMIDGECVLHRQATFIEGFIADGRPDAVFGEDFDFFFLPGINDEFPQPALGGGDYAAMYSDNPAAAEFMKFLMTAQSGDDWAAEGAYLSPFTTFDTSNYPSESIAKAGELLAGASDFRFDGSDLMPSDVGSSSQQGSFWLEMTEWISGNQELGESLEQVDGLFDESTS